MPFAVPVLGFKERFARVGRDEVFAYYKERYTPRMTTWIVVGDVAAGEALEWHEATLASDPSGLPLPRGLRTASKMKVSGMASSLPRYPGFIRRHAGLYGTSEGAERAAAARFAVVLRSSQPDTGNRV